MAQNFLLEDLNLNRSTPKEKDVHQQNTFLVEAEDSAFPDPVQSSPCPVQWDVFESHDIGLKPSNTSYFRFLKVCLKLIFAFLLCLLVLLLGLLNKFTLLKIYIHMTNHPDNATDPIKSLPILPRCYNNSSVPSQSFSPCSALLSTVKDSVQNSVAAVTNLWSLLICLCLPHLLASMPLARRIIFKKTRAIEKPTLFKVLFIETLHSIGLFMLIYLVLPKLGMVHSLLALEGVGILPIILKIAEHKHHRELSSLRRFSDWFVFVCQLSVPLYWLVVKPVINARLDRTDIILPVSLLLISFEWWDNYIGLRPGSSLCRSLLRLKKSLQRTRTRTYLVINLWKIFVCVFLFLVVFGNWNLNCLRVIFYMRPPGAEGCLAGQMSLSSTDQSSLEPLINALINISATFLCYQLVKTACKTMCQIPCFVLPLCLLPLLSILCFPAINIELFQWTDIAGSFHFRTPKTWKEYLLCTVTREHLPIGILWLVSILILTDQIFHASPERLASIEKLFVKPVYCGIILEKFFFLNRRRNDSQYKSIEKRLQNGSKYFHRSLENPSFSSILSGDEKRPMVFICATVWHESKKEMCEMLKSIFRLDIDQSARRHAREYFNVKLTDYYAIEVHLIVDDAFDVDGRINRFVKQLINVMDEAASCVHNVVLRMKSPTKYTTPYGGRLEWTLHGGNLLMVHLKDKKKIRTKKRWSQVMCMYWILGYRLMSIDEPSHLKQIIAENTYLLTLDGDVEFKPGALLKLLDRMKKDPSVGAACGRIHPVGSGPLIWYQKFEYAIGHWLQKSAEHVIGCVLCSPGCFSLFRGSALMDDNVLSTYTAVSSKSIDYLQRDQGEDRWLCTLLLRRGYRVEYCAAADAMTFAPERFDEFFNQRRRWIPSTLVNTIDLLSHWKIFVQNNDNISVLYVSYQGLLLVISFVSPGTVFLLIVGAINKAYPSITLGTSFFLNFLPLIFMMILCKYASTEKQLNFAFVLAMIYIVIMMAVFAGLCLEITESFCSTTSVFAVLVFGAFGLAAILHPQEFPAIFGGFFYLLAVPCMSVILIIYAMGNLHIVSWGTRENAAEQSPRLGTEEEEEEEDGHNQTATAPSVGLSFLGKSPHKNNVIERFRRMVHSVQNSVHKETNSNDAYNEILQRIQNLDFKMTQISRQRRTNERGTSVSSAPRTPVLINLNQNNIGLEQSNIADHDEPVLWYEDKILDEAKLSVISSEESKFWKEFISKYLLPLQTKPDDQKKIKESLKKLRNQLATLYILCNLCFITLILSLEYSSVSNERLSFEMPCYVSDDHTATVRPLSIVFVLVFGVLLVCQVVAMLIHRISTFLHIMASIDLSFSLPFTSAAQLSNLQLAKDLQSLDKDIVDPESLLISGSINNGEQYDEDNSTADWMESRLESLNRARSIPNRRKPPVWINRLDNKTQELEPDNLRGRFHENFKNITGRRYNKTESEKLVRERQIAGFHMNSLPALAIMANNSELIRQRWERATQKIIAQCRSQRVEPKLFGIVDQLSMPSQAASSTLFRATRNNRQDPPETPTTVKFKEMQ